MQFLKNHTIFQLPDLESYKGHKALSASIIKSAPFGGIESFEVPKLTGVVSDFISNIILIPRRPGPFFELAEQLESELLRGHIQLPTRPKNAFPELLIKHQITRFRYIEHRLQSQRLHHFHVSKIHGLS